MKKIPFLILLFLVSAGSIIAQENDLLDLVGTDSITKEYVKNAFKSSRVINGHSMEMIGKGVLDVRILHRFGTINSGASNLFGLDQANMRFGFDYGLGNRATIGIGRSTVGKELDGFIKLRPVWQSKGPGSVPFSLLWISGITVNTTQTPEGEKTPELSTRVAYYHEVIIGRKFTDNFSLQLAPVFVHRNEVEGLVGENDTWALGTGARMKLSKRIAFVADYHHIISGKVPGTKNPISVGFDIETGGHVFQLHFSNATGMNEKAFLTNTTDDFWKGEIHFGFNLSRVFTISRPKAKLND